MFTYIQYINPHQLKKTLQIVVGRLGLEMDRKVCPTTTSSSTKISRTIYYYIISLLLLTYTRNVLFGILYQIIIIDKIVYNFIIIT